VVCLAVIISMHKGRKILHKLSVEQPTHPAQQRVQIACNVATATFWDMLVDFVGVGLFDPAWLLEVNEAHPFLHVVQDAEGNGHLQVNRPQQQQHH
jgi:hypothetical protein